MKSMLLIAIALSTLFLTGCPKSKPNVPPAIANRIANYEIARLDNDLEDYDCATLGFISDSSRGNTGTTGGKAGSGGRGTCGSIGRDDAMARRIRDRVINRLKANIDANYHEFENQLFTGRASYNVLFDITELGSAVATTITNGERAKTIIAAALTGFKGGRKSIDENFFRERTTAVIISQMQASRADLETNILKNLREKDVTAYPLEAALGDLINYFYAGTLQKGLQELAQQTGQNAVDAKNELQEEKRRAGIVGAPSIDVLKVTNENFIAIRDVLERTAAAETKAQSLIDEEKKKTPAPTPDRLKELEADKKKTLSGLRTVFDLIEADSKLSPLLDKIPEKYGKSSPALKTRLETRLKELKETPDAASLDDFDFILTKLNGVIGESIDADPTLAGRLKTILSTFKL